MINYYGKYIPNLNKMVFPLNQFLKKEVDFSRTKNKKKGNEFHKAKNTFLSSRYLIHLHQKLLQMLITNSPYRVDVSFSYILPNEFEQVMIM